MKTVTFYFVSGRGWVTLEQGKVERRVTDVEFLGLIVPRLTNHYPVPEPRVITVTLEEVVAMQTLLAPWEGAMMDGPPLKTKPVVEHFPNCSPNCPEKVPGEAPQQLERVDIGYGFMYICVDCGAYVFVKK